MTEHCYAMAFWKAAGAYSLGYLNPPRGVEGVVCYDPYLRDTRPFYCLAYRAITRRGQAAQKNRGSSRKKYM